MIEKLFEYLLEKIPELYLPLLITILLFPILVVNSIIVITYFFIPIFIPILYLISHRIRRLQIKLNNEDKSNGIPYRSGVIIKKINDYVIENFPTPIIRKVAFFKVQRELFDLYLFGVCRFYDGISEGLKKIKFKSIKPISISESNNKELQDSFKTKLRNFPEVIVFSFILMLLFLIPILILSVPIIITSLVYIIIL